MSVRVSDSLDDLRGSFGADVVHTGNEVWRYTAAGVKPGSIVAAADVEQIRATVRRAAEKEPRTHHRRVQTVPCQSIRNLPVLERRTARVLFPFRVAFLTTRWRRE